MDTLQQKTFLLSEEGKAAIVRLHIDGITEYLRQLETAVFPTGMLESIELSNKA